MNINENLKLFRKKKGLTQKELAEKIGVTSTTITRYEKNVRTPDINTLQKISSALEIPLNILLSTTINQFEEITKDILEYITTFNMITPYDPYIQQQLPTSEQCFKDYFGFEFPSNKKLDEDDLTFMLFTIINNDLNKFIQLFSLYYELILSFKKQNINIIDNTLKEFNISVEKLTSDLNTDTDTSLPQIFENSTGNKYIDYSFNEIKKVTKAECWRYFFGLVDYVKGTSKNENLMLIGKDMDELKPLFNKIYEIIELELLSILYKRGQLINKSSIEGDESNGNKKE